MHNKVSEPVLWKESVGHFTYTQLGAGFSGCLSKAKDVAVRAQVD